jgi:hypothetical protein
MSTLARIPPATVDGLASAKQAVPSLLAFIDALPASVESERKLGESLAATRKLIADLEAQRTAITKPMLEAKRQTDALFSPTTKAFSSLETRIRERLAEMARARILAERAALEAAKTALAAGDEAALDEAVGSLQGAVELSGAAAKAVWVVAEVDVGLLPDAYKIVSLNREAVDRVLRDHGDSDRAPVVPGVRFELDVKVRAKRA